jgi:hypothetical protein
VKVADWIREGWEPPFATIEDWLRDQLGEAKLEEEATYAVELRPENDGGGYAVRILVATDAALADFTWERPAAVGRRVLTAAYYGWHEVRGLRLTSETRLNPATLMHRSAMWGLRIEMPELTITDATEDEALLEFWSVCMGHLGDSTA